MTTSVHTNSSALIALQNLNATNSKLSSVQNRVSTGLKVQGAKDNAATWAIAQNQRADTSSLEAVKTSLNRATSIADVALAAGSQISDILTELKQKAVAASDPSASEASKKAYNDEFKSLVASITSFANNATFDGKNLFDGSLTANLEFLASADGEETITLTPQAMTAAALGLDALDLETDAEAALEAVTEALANSSSMLAELGAQAKQIERHTTFVGKLMDSLEVGVGNLVDADLAKESARLQALQVQQQLGTQALAIANQAPQSILSLFQG
ncbi:MULTISPECIES: flagellin [unclassified Brevundimonas]|uniref:flagellin n=1 Tax=unclassified Brevundimonas TaxID=2622653 RepID=UPI0025BF6E51|nr:MULTISPECIES: flagellin [unclassified Brevundimonas]